MNLRSFLVGNLAAFLHSAKRFPLTLALGVAGSLFATFDLWSKTGYAHWLEPVTLLNAAHRACWLCIPLSLALALFAEARGHGRKGRLACGAFVLAVAALAAFYFHGESRAVFGLRYALWMTASVAAAMTAPVFARQGTERYRHFNSVLFQRVLSAYALVIPLAGGLCAGLWSLEELFRIDVDSDTYLAVWFCAAGIFGTAYFTGNAPRLRDDARENPAFLRGLTRFILLPLSSVYLVILYAYVVRLLVLREWSEGRVSSLILACAVLGIVTHLLLQEREEGAEEVTMGRAFKKAFYPALAPLVAVLFLALWRRSSEYGLTESRLLAWVAACWLAAAVLYFTLFRKARVEAIPLTIGLVAFLISVGPWSVFETSLRSQTGRLEKHLKASGRLVDGRLVRASAPMSEDAEFEISRGLHFLGERDALGRLKPWFASPGEDCKFCVVLKDSLPSAESLAGALGVRWMPYASHEKEGRLTFVADEAALDVRGYDLVVPFELDAWVEDAAFVSRTPPVMNGYAMEGGRAEGLVLIRYAGGEKKRVTSVAVARLAALARGDSLAVRSTSDRPLPADSLRLDWEDAEGRFSLRVQRLGVENDGRGGRRVFEAKGFLLIAPPR